MSRKPRYQFSLGPSGQRALDRLKEITDTESLSDLLNDALNAYLWLANESEQGRIVCSIDGTTGSFSELTHATLDSIRDPGKEEVSRQLGLIGQKLILERRRTELLHAVVGDIAVVTKTEKANGNHTENTESVVDLETLVRTRS